MILEIPLNNNGLAYTPPSHLSKECLACKFYHNKCGSSREKLNRCIWEQKLTHGTPPPGQWDTAYTVVGSCLCFRGYDGASTFKVLYE